MIFVWLNKRPWKHPGPIVNMAVRNAHSLAALGHETHLCVSAGKDVVANVKTDLRGFYGVNPLPTLHVHRISRWRIGTSELSMSAFFSAFRRARRLAKRDRTVVVTREATFLPLLAWLCSNRRIQGFYEAHDFFPDLSWRTDRIKIGDRRQSWLERTFLPRISGLICITQAQQELYRRALPKVRSCALPLGTELLPAADSERRRQMRTLVYVGHLHASKGVKMLLGAVRELARHGIRVAFWGGSEPQIVRMREQLVREGLADAAQFAGFRAPQELHRALAEEASVGIVALQDTFYNRYLTCPVKALDYLSHGLPVIGSDLPSVREVVNGAGRFIAPDDAEGLARTAVELLDDARSYHEAAQASHARAASLLWSERAKRIVEFAAERDREASDYG
jgi:glycosyltransferase involved in cell wall biosynthesis